MEKEEVEVGNSEVERALKFHGDVFDLAATKFSMAKNSFVKAGFTEDQAFRLIELTIRDLLELVQRELQKND